MSVNISFDGVRLQSYSHGWTIAEEKVVEDEDSENYGETYLGRKSYAPTLQSGLERVLEEKLRSSDAESVEELKQIHRDFQARLADLFAITVVEPD